MADERLRADCRTPKSRVRSRVQRCLLALVSLGILLAAGLASGAESEITISNTAIRAMLMDQLYTDDGKFHLLRGARCQFAYLELPAVVITRGRVHIRTRLTGMLGVEDAGGCAGSTESFHVTVSGEPYFSGEFLGLTDLSVDQVSNELYRLVLQNVLDQAVPRAIEINLREGLEQLIAGQGASYEVRVSKLEVTNLVADEDRVHANLSFALSAR